MNILKWVPLALRVVTALPKIQHTIEAITHIKSGPDKKQAAIDAILGSVDIAQDVSEKDILAHPKVQEALGKANDVLVELQNVIAQVTKDKQ